MKTPYDIDPLDLVLLMEEAAEVQVAAAKCLRFGPDNVFEGYANNQSKIEMLQTEVGDFLAILDRIPVSWGKIYDARQAKHERLKEMGPEGKYGRGML